MREASKVEQLIVTAEREILRKLPGEPYGEYLNSLKLKEEINRLSSENEDLRARLGLSSASSDLSKEYLQLGNVNQHQFWQLQQINHWFSLLNRRVPPRCNRMLFRVEIACMRSVVSFTVTLPVLNLSMRPIAM